MAVFILPIIALIVYIIYEIRTYGFRFPSFDQVLTAFITVGLAGIITFIMFIIFSAIPGKGHMVGVPESKSLYALQDNNNNNEGYFLGCGSNNSELEYYYVYMTDDGGYKTDKIAAKDITVYYTDEDYRIDTVYFEFDNIIHRFFGIGYIEKRIYIPQGSILQDYLIDLQ